MPVFRSSPVVPGPDPPCGFGLWSVLYFTRMNPLLKAPPLPFARLCTLLAGIVALCCASPASARQREVLHPSAVAQRTVTAPGDQFAIAFIMEFDEGWHAWPNKPVLPQGVDVDATPTVVRVPKDVTLPKGVQVFTTDIQWPEPHEIESAGFTGDPIKVLSYSERAVAFVPVVIGPDAAPGKVTIPLEVHYQACNDTSCMQPTTGKASVTFEIVASIDAVKNSASESEFAPFKPTVFAKLHAGGTPPSPPPDAPAPKGSGTPAPPQASAPPATSLFGYSLPDPRSPLGIIVLLVVSMIGGAVMNLTPCVLPVIPIKVMTLQQHASASGTHGSAVGLGLWMALGIVAFWTAIGVPMAISSAFDPSRFIFGTWWVTLGIGLVIVMMGLGILGMFNLTLPQSVYAVNPKADTPWGSFVFGVMTAILGLPCFGFVAGGLLAAAATMPGVAIMSVFVGIGAGMAIPFLVLAAFPQLIKKMPRTGPVSELVKQVMGLMLLAAAAFFIATGLKTLIASKPYFGPTMRWWATAFFLSLAGVWLIFRTFQISRDPLRRAVFTLFGVLLAFFSIAFARTETTVARDNYLRLLAANGGHDDTFVTGAWNHYTPAKFEKARAAGKVVIADFTADWCLICKTLKAGVLDVNPLNAELMKNDVILFEIDLSDEQAPGWKFLNSIGRVGIPTLAVFAPGVEQPEIFNAYTSGTVMDALTRARSRAQK